MATLVTPRRRIAFAVKGVVAVALVLAAYWSAGTRCWGSGCTCTPHLVDSYRHPYSRSGALAVNTVARLLYSSADDAMAIAVFDLDDVMRGPLFNVPTEGYLTGAALDETANKLYVPQGFSKSVRVIDGATHAFHDIVVPDVTNAIGSIVVDPMRHRLYVVRSDDFDVAVFDTRTERFAGAVATACCSTPDMRLALDATTGSLFVLETVVGRLSAYDLDGRQIAMMDVGVPSTRIGIDPLMRRAYASNGEVQQLAVIDIEPSSPRAFTVVDHIELRDRPLEIALDPQTKIGYVTNSHIDTLSLIDLTTSRWIMDVPVGLQPSYLAVDPATARVFVALGNQEVVVVQGCRAVRRGLAGLVDWMRRPTPRQEPRVVATPVEQNSPTEAAERRAYVRMERMFVNRTQCVDGATTHEAALAMAQIEASGARVVDGGAAGQFCGVARDFPQPDLAAAGYYYSVPVLEPGAEMPTVWTFESATRSMSTGPRPESMHVTRAEQAPDTPWRESLWWLSRCKTKVPAEECAR